MDENEETRVANAVDPDQQIVYVKEKPMLKLFIGAIVSIVSITVFLFLVGFLMSLVGFRPPTFDKQIIQDQWDKTVNDPARSYSDCVAKGGAIQESFPPGCTYKGDSFQQSLPEACADLEADGGSLEGTPCDPNVDPAYAAGQKAGEVYKETKEAGQAFFEGFAEELAQE